MTENFIKSIHEKKKIRLTFHSQKDNAIITRLCTPMDFGVGRIALNRAERYHLWDYESKSGNHTLSLLPEKIVKMEFTNIDFEPSDFVIWTTNWIIKRDWGKFS